jgi:hypothetical protein
LPTPRAIAVASISVGWRNNNLSVSIFHMIVL